MVKRGVKTKLSGDKFESILLESRPKQFLITVYLGRICENLTTLFFDSQGEKRRQCIALSSIFNAAS